MPAEEGLPAADVAVGSVDAFDLVGKGVMKEGIEVIEVPAFGGGVHEGVE